MKKLSYEEASFVRRLNQLLEKNGKTKTELAAAIGYTMAERLCQAKLGSHLIRPATRATFSVWRRLA